MRAYFAIFPTVVLLLCFFASTAESSKVAAKHELPGLVRKKSSTKKKNVKKAVKKAAKKAIKKKIKKKLKKKKKKKRKKRIIKSSGGGNSVACFPAQGWAQLVGGKRVFLSQLQIGDIVRSGSNSYSQVFMFSHKLNGMHKFLLFETQTEKLAVSRRHLVYSSKGLGVADDISVGDSLMLANGSMVNVLSIKLVRMKGLLNPNTLDGNIVVNGFLTSTFTDDIRTPSAVSLLAPLRAVYILWGRDASRGCIGAGGLIDSVLMSVLTGIRLLYHL